MIVKWRTNRYGRAAIERVECTRETAQTVWYMQQDAWRKTDTEHRAAKESSGERYHDSWEDAKAYLLESANLSVIHARNALQRANDTLGNVKGLKKPAESE